MKTVIVKTNIIISIPGLTALMVLGGMVIIIIKYNIIS